MFIIRIIGAAYRQLIHNQRREVAFWVLAAFLPTFLIERWIVRTFPDVFLVVNGVHVHHLTYGILILAITGYVAMLLNRQEKPWLALIYGVGLGMAFDEFGMWLHLADNYYNEQSYDAIIVITSILIGLVYFADLWQAIARRLWRRRPRLEK